MIVLKRVSAALLLSVVLTGGSSTNGVANSNMQTREAVPPPLGFVTYCAQHLEFCRTKYTDATPVPMTATRWQELSGVQASVNTAIKPASDFNSGGVEENWSMAENGVGDCEDYALRKKQALIDKGWSPASLLLTTAITEKGERHVVLTVVTDQGDYVLDNRYAEPKSWEKLAYSWLARQDQYNPLIWRKATGYAEQRLASLK